MEMYKKGYKDALSDLEATIEASQRGNAGHPNMWGRVLNDLIAWLHSHNEALQHASDEQFDFDDEQDFELDEEAIEWILEHFGSEATIYIVKGGE